MTITHQQHFVDAYQVISERYAVDTRDRDYLQMLQKQSLDFQRSRVQQYVESPEKAGERTVTSLLATAVPVGELAEDDLT